MPNLWCPVFVIVWQQAGAALGTLVSSGHGEDSLYTELLYLSEELAMRSHNIKHRLTRGSSKVSPLHCLLICGALCHGAWLGWCGVGTDSGQRSGELTPVSGLLCIVPNPELDAANFQRSRQQRLRTKANFLTESRTFCSGSGQVVSNFLSLSRHPVQACISYISPCELVQYIHIVH